MELVLKTKTCGEVILSFKCELIMMHSQFISAQFEPDKIGVQVSGYSSNNLLTIAFTTLGDGIGNYQKWAFKLDNNFPQAETFFRSIGFTRDESYQLFR